MSADGGMVAWAWQGDRINLFRCRQAKDRIHQGVRIPELVA